MQFVVLIVRWSLTKSLSKGLIEEIGRTEGPGRPIIYGVTERFSSTFWLGIN